MKCLSLWQPWASLIALGEKHVETRSWETLYRGKLLIHAAMRESTRETYALLSGNAYFHRAFLNHFSSMPKALDAMPYGKILGVCDLIGCWPTGHMDVITRGGKNAITEAERAFGNYEPGRFAWMLSSIKAFKEPIPFRGRQRIFNVPDELVAQQIARAA